MENPVCQLCGKEKQDATCFCQQCNQDTPNHHIVNIFEQIKVSDCLDAKKYSKGKKGRNFDWHSISGYFGSVEKEKFPDGVYKEQIVDRDQNKYRKLVIDVKTGKKVKDIEQKLSDHK